MGLDGLSMGNLGLHKEVTSAQMSNQAEQLANKDVGFKIKDIVEIGKEKGIEVKEDGSNKNEFFEQNFKEEEENSENNFAKKFDEKIFETSDPKEFCVRVNPKTEMIELFNNKENKMVETISATDLMQLISKLDSASGIIVNRKI
jgi:hypothetical protein